MFFFWHCRTTVIFCFKVWRASLEEGGRGWEVADLLQRLSIRQKEETSHTHTSALGRGCTSQRAWIPREELFFYVCRRGDVTQSEYVTFHHTSHYTSLEGSVTKNPPRSPPLLLESAGPLLLTHFSWSDLLCR